jgi:hypothetical protein
VLGPHLPTTLVVPALGASGHGRIVTVSTVAAGGPDLADTQFERRRYTGIAAYRASKQASRAIVCSGPRHPRGSDDIDSAEVLGNVFEHLLLGVEVADVDGPSAGIPVAAQPHGVGVDAFGGQVEQRNGGAACARRARVRPAPRPPPAPVIATVLLVRSSLMTSPQW